MDKGRVVGNNVREARRGRLQKNTSIRRRGKIFLNSVRNWRVKRK